MNLGTRLLILAALPLAISCTSEPGGGLGATDGAALPDASSGPRDAAPLPTDGAVLTDAGNPVADGGLLDADVPPPPPDAGTQMCRTERDCLRALGRPPVCPDGRPGNWACEQNLCIVECTPTETCSNDCDCPFELSCVQGACRPLNRQNFCCDNPNCRPGNQCVQADGTASTCPEPPPPVDGGVPPGDGGVPPTVPVGSACVAPNDCNGGVCLDQSQGFVDGYCTQQCGRGGNNCPVGATCQEFGPRQSFCLDECATATDCRMGYECVRLGTAQSRVCFPVPEGSTNPMGDPVGSACAADNDCEQGLTCLQDQGWPGGYCTRVYCDPMTNPCPSASSCYAFPASYSLCLADCPSGGSQSTCRTGYYCLGPSGGPGGCLGN